ncbi:hypothetical protein D3C72_1715000 [compost metagenome]
MRRRAFQAMLVLVVDIQKIRRSGQSAFLRIGGEDAADRGVQALVPLDEGAVAVKGEPLRAG